MLALPISFRYNFTGKQPESHFLRSPRLSVRDEFDQISDHYNYFGLELIIFKSDILFLH